MVHFSISKLDLLVHIYISTSTVFGESKAHLLPINKEAMEKGAEVVRNRK